MNYSRIVFIFLFICVIGVSSASAGQYDYVVLPVELWSCFDYAMDYSKNNPEWGMVLISDHPRFWGIGNSHFVNYQINENEELITYGYDDKNNITKKIAGWEHDTCVHTYYHFYVNGEIPTRYFRYKLPNAEAVYNAL